MMVIYVTVISSDILLQASKGLIRSYVFGVGVEDFEGEGTQFWTMGCRVQNKLYSQAKKHFSSSFKQIPPSYVLQQRSG